VPTRIRHFGVDSYVTSSPRNGCWLKLLLYGGRLSAAVDLCDEAIRNALRASIETVREARPFVIDAWVLLPDHLHCEWTLPDGDADFSTRWMIIKLPAWAQRRAHPTWLTPCHLILP
jgi:hypothetical protein